MRCVALMFPDNVPDGNHITKNYQFKQNEPRNARSLNEKSKIMNKKILFIILILAGVQNNQLFSQVGNADTSKIKTHNLSEVEIYADTSTGKASLIQPVSKIKINSVELNRGTGLYLDDAINTSIPGVYMEKRTISGGQQFNIRGYGNGARGTNGVSSNFDGQGTKVYLNGIPVTDAECITVLDDIDFGSLGSVEITKGPSGTIYGMAIAGVVNMETRKAEKNKVSLSENFMAGSYGLLRSTSTIEIGGEKSSLLINYGRQKFDGFMVHTASQKDFVNMIGDIRINDKQRFTSYIGFSDSYDERNGELTIQQWDTLDYSGNINYINNNAHSAVKSLRAGFGHTYQICKTVSNTTSLFGTAQNIDNSSAGGWTDKNPLNYGFRSTFDMNFKVSDKITLTGVTGVEMQKMNAVTNGYKMAADSTNLTGYFTITTNRSIQSTMSAAASAFTQWTLFMPKDISVTAGVGYNSMKLRLDDRLWGATNNHPSNITPKYYEAQYNDMISPSFAINKKIKGVASVYASFSSGYKAPVSSYFFIPTTGQVNTGLVPEKGTQMEIGTKGSLMNNRFYYALVAFNVKFSNKMTTVAVPNPANTVTLYTYMANGGALNNSGLEVLLKYEVMKNKDGFITSLRPFANLTYSSFKYEDFKFEKIGKDITNHDSLVVVDYSGNPVAGVPPIVFNIGVDVDTKIGLYGNVNFNYRDAMYYTSDAANETESFTLLNAKIGFRKEIKHWGFDLYAGANNMMGSQAYQMVFINQLPDAYLAAPNEINFFGGIKLKYIF